MKLKRWEVALAAVLMVSGLICVTVSVAREDELAGDTSLWLTVLGMALICVPVGVFIGRLSGRLVVSIMKNRQDHQGDQQEH
ncbi:hypothetical protein ACIA49_06065 [Kribbella sp. NPDC051587]|uniref:hypothetical protein n=1 Tax=Kribbella sp. NPDC051587 TaxID=3364119 RepID=UPI00378B4623